MKNEISIPHEPKPASKTSCTTVARIHLRNYLKYLMSKGYINVLLILNRS